MTDTHSGEAEQEADGTDQTGGYCFGCSETYTHAEWIRQRYRDDRGVAKSAAFCPHCGRLQVSTRIAEEIVDGDLPSHDEVIDGHNPGYLIEDDRQLVTDGGRCAHNWERHRTIGETVIYCCRNCPQTAREEVADGAE